MAAAPAAIPVNPNSAAIIAIIRKITAQRNMFHLLRNESNQATTMRGRFSEHLGPSTMRMALPRMEQLSSASSQDVIIAVAPFVYCDQS
jgi:hypothetical protein